MKWHPELAPSQIFVALDGVKEFSALAGVVRTLETTGVSFKVTPELVYRFGAEWLKKIGLCGPKLFLDHKIHDIGANSTNILNAIMAELQPGFITVHASNPETTLCKLVQTAQEINPSTQLVAVTVLTDMNFDDCVLAYNDSPQEAVNSLARHALAAGINHVVCPPQQVSILKERLPNLTVITSGILPTGSQPEDPQRTVTASRAIVMGADYLVIGRSIMEARNPVSAVKEFIDEISVAKAIAA